MKKYDAIFFDMDGTVVDTLNSITQAVNHTLRQFNMPEYNPDQLRPALGYGARHLLEQAVPEGTSTDVLDNITAQYLPYYAAHANDNILIYKGILPLLKKLKTRGFPVAIISNKPDTALQPLAKKYFSGLLNLAVGEREGVRRKPEPDMLVNTAGQLGVELMRCLYVGDSEVDLLTAKNTGIDCVTVCWGFRSREELLQAGATVLIDEPSELLDYLES